MKKILYSLLLLILVLMSGCSTNQTGASFAVLPEKIVNTPLNTNIIHTGDMYATRTTVNINSGETIYIKANSSLNTHILERRIYAVTTGVNLDFTIDLYENGTDNSSNQELDYYNVNRALNYDNNTFFIYTNITGVNLTQSTLLPFGNKILSDKKFSATTISNTEYIFKPDTNYYLEITNNDGGILSLEIYWMWYELE